MDIAAIQIAYEIFADLLMEEKVYLDPNLTFSLICSWIGVPEKELDRYIVKEMGMSGKDIIHKFRADEPLRLRQKYGDLLRRFEEAAGRDNKGDKSGEDKK